MYVPEGLYAAQGKHCLGGLETFVCWSILMNVGSSSQCGLLFYN